MRSWDHLSMSYGTTQCYLPPDRGDFQRSRSRVKVKAMEVQKLVKMADFKVYLLCQYACNQNTQWRIVILQDSRSVFFRADFWNSSSFGVTWLSNFRNLANFQWWFLWNWLSNQLRVWFSMPIVSSEWTTLSIGLFALVFVTWLWSQELKVSPYTGLILLVVLLYIFWGYVICLWM